MSFTWDELELMKTKTPWQHKLPPTCPECGYNLTGLPADRCPECGNHFDWNQVRHRANAIMTRIERVNQANKDAKIGMIISLIGWALIGIAHLPGLDSLIVAAHITAILAALTSLGLSLQVLRLRRVPIWARVYLAHPPNVMLCTSAIIMALALIAGAILLS